LASCAMNGPQGELRALSGSGRKRRTLQDRYGAEEPKRSIRGGTKKKEKKVVVIALAGAQLFAPRRAGRDDRNFEEAIL